MVTVDAATREWHTRAPEMEREKEGTAGARKANMVRVLGMEMEMESELGRRMRSCYEIRKESENDKDWA